jgi:membrane protease YdiL (CAAX protease family)
MTPENDPEERLPFHTGYALVITIGAIFVQLVVFLMLAASSGAATPARLGIASIVGYGALLALSAPRIPDPPGAALGFTRAPALAWLAAALMLSSILLVSEVDNLFRAIYPMPESAPGADRPGGFALVEFAIVYTVVLPVVYELFFRGLIQPRIVEQLGRTRGVLATAALSGLSWAVLGGPWAFVSRATEGLVFGVVREASGSLMPGLLLHVLFGAVSTLATVELFGIPGFDDLSAPHTPILWLMPAALLTGVSLRICQTLLAARSG